MAKYLMLKHYRGPKTGEIDMVDSGNWTPEEWDAHVQYMRDFADQPKRIR
ncbi:MAG: hypothetical protein R2845_02670 [Thermomicrobiales bacterium]